MLETKPLIPAHYSFVQLSEPFKIFEFDFWKRPDSRGETELQVKATSDGIVHAVVSWCDVHTLMIITCSNLNIIFPRLWI